MWPNPQFPADLVRFIEEILNGKIHFFMQCKNEIFEPDPTKMRILLFLLMKTYLGLSDHDDRFFNNIVSKNEANTFSFSILLEERISNCDSDHGLLIYSNEAIEYMWRLYNLLVKQEPSLDVVTKHSAVKSTLIIIWNHKSICKSYWKMGSVHGICFN